MLHDKNSKHNSFLEIDPKTLMVKIKRQEHEKYELYQEDVKLCMASK